ncbi:MAG TPA: DoxX family protein [Pricia sp.]|nr:DoxX family protein [Pricia sp.]
MENQFSHAPEILILMFLIIVFLQSSIDKIFDWKGNFTFLTGHFEHTPLQDLVPFLLGTIMLVEMAAGILCAAGLFQLVVFNEGSLAFYGAVLASLALLMLLFGQRLAKDYDGAKTIAVYFIPAVFLVFLLQ